MCDTNERRTLGTTKLKQMILAELRLNAKTNKNGVWGEKNVGHRVIWIVEIDYHGLEAVGRFLT